METVDKLSNVSLIVITLNEEDNLGKCLGSAMGVGEIIIVDSFSSDRTVEIAENFGAQVFLREFFSNAQQKNWAIHKAKKEWILILDADESLSPELREEIEGELISPQADGYWLKRKNEFMGRNIRFCGWKKDKVLRFFRVGKGKYNDRSVHEKLILDGKISIFKSYMYHKSYRNVSDYLDRMKKYSKWGAEDLYSKGKFWFPGIIVHPIWRFIRMYFLQLGFLDGKSGFLLCSTAVASIFFKYVYLVELYMS
ncbi:glycosyltransferase family 2 protein, partial [bacterium]|nr:glycosyltransferase family 2 protein [bacterium]